MFTFIQNHCKPVAFAVLLCGSSSLLHADDPVVPSVPSPAQAEVVPQTFLERDPDTGMYQLVLIQPNGEKKVLQTFPNGVPLPANPVSPTDADYLQAIQSLAAGDRYIIGVELKTIPAGLHARLGIEENCGLLVGDLMPDKPAAAAGVKQGDILLKINGKPVSQPGDVVRMVSETKAQPVTLTLKRDAEPFDLQVTPVEAPKEWSPTGNLAGKKLPPGALPPGVQLIGPGVLLDKSSDPAALQAEALRNSLRPEFDVFKDVIRARCEYYDKRLQALDEQVKSLTEQIQQLQEQLKSK